LSYLFYEKGRACGTMGERKGANGVTVGKPEGKKTTLKT
jgi:hypothetical protein